MCLRYYFFCHQVTKAQSYTKDKLLLFSSLCFFVSLRLGGILSFTIFRNCNSV